MRGGAIQRGDGPNEAEGASLQWGGGSKDSGSLASVYCIHVLRDNSPRSGILGLMKSFYSRGQKLRGFIGTLECFYIRKRYSKDWGSNLAAFSLLWDTKMVDVTSRERALF